MGSAGGVVAQPALGRAADVYGYGASYVIAAAIQALALPFVSSPGTRMPPRIRSCRTSPRLP
jgi:hypothetical protein